MTEEKKKSNRTPLIIIGLVVVGTIILCNLPSSDYEPPPPKVDPRITYSITGTATSVSITLENETGNTEQGDFKVPFNMSFRVPVGTFVYISAQNNGKTGSVTCQIFVDGKVQEEATSTGAYKIATCSGSVGRD